MTATPHNHRLVQFQQAHVKLQRWVEDKYVERLGHKSLDMYAANPGYSMFCGDKILGAAGIVECVPRVGEAWAIFVNPEGHHNALLRSIARTLPRLAETMNMRRVQATVRADFDKGHFLAKWLGFEYEATHRKAGIMGEDLCVYVRFFAD